jgi:hypothetical protein
LYCFIYTFLYEGHRLWAYEGKKEKKNVGPNMDVTHDGKNYIIKNCLISYSSLNILRAIKSKGMARTCNMQG